MAHADEAWMRRALELAERGRGAVEPNPLVGAVIVRDGALVGEGWHERFGEAHAEVRALAAAGAAARGATLYVTLEPCCHHGKTPPCTEAVLRAGIGRVVAAMADPFPAVSGRGAALLRAAGIPIDVGLLETDARQLNAPYLKLMATGRPYVHAKWAMSLDGKIATRTGHSHWISGPEARRWVHELRGRMDAILIGRGTAYADDPLLTARPPGPRTPLRIVLTRTGSLPEGGRLLQTAREVPLLIVTAADADADRIRGLAARGAQILGLPTRDPAEMISALLDELGRRRMTNLLVEGGAEVLGRFRDADAIDEVHVFIAPILVGGAEALSPMAGVGVAPITDAWRLANWSIAPVGEDLVIHGRRRTP